MGFQLWRTRAEELELRSAPQATDGAGIVTLVSTTEPTDFPMPEVDPNGVDLAQVRRMLALSPAERLRVLESALASMMKVRDAAQRAQVSRNPAAPR